MLSYAGYTPEDNQADFGPISLLLTILGNIRDYIGGSKDDLLRFS